MCQINSWSSTSIQGFIWSYLIRFFNVRNNNSVDRSLYKYIQPCWEKRISKTFFLPNQYQRLGIGYCCADIQVTIGNDAKPAVPNSCGCDGMRRRRWRRPMQLRGQDGVRTDADGTGQGAWPRHGNRHGAHSCSRRNSDSGSCNRHCDASTVRLRSSRQNAPKTRLASGNRNENSWQKPTIARSWQSGVIEIRISSCHKEWIQRAPHGQFILLKTISFPYLITIIWNGSNNQMDYLFAFFNMQRFKELSFNLCFSRD